MFNGREMRSLIADDGTLTLSLAEVATAPPGDDEVVVRVEAAPLNPSDQGLMFAAADFATLTAGGSASSPVATLKVAPDRLHGQRLRIGKALPIGNEGAGTVVAAGRDVKQLEGRRVGMIGGGMYADYRKLRAQDVMPLPAGASAAEGASMFVNPLTALGFVETMRREGHTALVHTAAASNLGQMLQRICRADGIPLVNIVRSGRQAQLLRDLGATHVLDSQDADFPAQLVAALEQTGATLAFDPIGGGTLGSRILQAMEQVATGKLTEYSRYGSDTYKQLYVYGALDPSPLQLNRTGFGMSWGVGGWLLFPFLRKAGPEVAARLRQRVADELTTTFASHYTQVIGLAQALQPEVMRAYQKKATGEKYLIDPTLG